MKVTLNIGLSNNPLHWIYISRQLAYHTYGVTLKWSRVEKGKYLDKTEETLIVKMKTKMSIEELEKYIELLCMALNQDCIACQIKSKNLKISNLIYNPTYEGKRETFKHKYFLT